MVNDKRQKMHRTFLTANGQACKVFNCFGFVWAFFIIRIMVCLAMIHYYVVLDVWWNESTDMAHGCEFSHMIYGFWILPKNIRKWKHAYLLHYIQSLHTWHVLFLLINYYSFVILEFGFANAKNVLCIMYACTHYYDYDYLIGHTK